MSCNILSVYCVSIEVCSTTSKTGFDFCYTKICLRVASRVPERLNTSDLSKLGNDKKI